MSRPRVPRLCGQPLGLRRHVCALFSDPARAFDVHVEYVAEGLEGGERVFAVVPSGRVPVHRARLAGAGLPSDRAERDGRLVLRDWDATYLAEETFSPDAMQARVRDAVAAVRDEGLPRVRMWGDMGWVASRPPAVDALLEYERRADRIAAAFPDDVFVCAYDATAIPGRLLAQLAALHPVVVFDDRLYENAT